MKFVETGKTFIRMNGKKIPIFTVLSRSMPCEMTALGSDPVSGNQMALLEMKRNNINVSVAEVPLE